jgi:ribonuclease D
MDASFGNTDSGDTFPPEVGPQAWEDIDMPREPVEQGLSAGFEEPGQVLSAGPDVAFRLVETAGEVRQALAEIAAYGGRVGLDLETTGLDPLTAQARLLQVAHDHGPVLVVDLFKAGGLHAFCEELERLRPVAHNAVFDAGFLWRAGVRAVPDCTMLAAHVLTGRREKLSALAETHLGVEMEKELQKADWSGELTEAHLRYAAFDALVTLRLWPILEAEIAERAGL